MCEAIAEVRIGRLRILRSWLTTLHCCVDWFRIYTKNYSFDDDGYVLYASFFSVCLSAVYVKLVIGYSWKCDQICIFGQGKCHNTIKFWKSSASVSCCYSENWKKNFKFAPLFIVCHANGLCRGGLQRSAAICNSVANVLHSTRNR